MLRQASVSFKALPSAGCTADGCFAWFKTARKGAKQRKEALKGAKRRKEAQRHLIAFITRPAQIRLHD